MRTDKRPIWSQNDPSPTPTVHRSKERKCSSRGYNLEVGGSVNRHAPISYSIHLFVTRRGCHPLFGGGSADWYDSDKLESRGHQSDRQSRSSRTTPPQADRGTAAVGGGDP